MKLAIPVFHTEFDPLQYSINGFGKIPPNGDFGDFRWRFWRFSRQDLNRMFQNWAHFVATHLPCIMPLITLLGKFFSLSSSSRPGWVENHFHSMQVLVTVLTPFRHSWKELLVTFDQEASHFWPCVIDSKRISNEWTVSYVKTLISWQRPKKAKFSIWVPKLTLALCWKRILPRRSTRQKIIHQVVNKRMQDFTICIKM